MKSLLSLLILCLLAAYAFAAPTGPHGEHSPPHHAAAVDASWKFWPVQVVGHELWPAGRYKVIGGVWHRLDAGPVSPLPWPPPLRARWSTKDNGWIIENWPDLP